MADTGGFEDNNRYEGQDAPTYGEIPPLPRDGYGVSENGQATYSAPTESVPNQQPAYGYPPAAPQMPQPQIPPQPYGPPNQYGQVPPYGQPNPYGPTPYGQPNPYGYQQTPGTNGLSIAALITTLAGGFFACGIGFLVGPILGFVALNQIKQSGEQGRGMALASIIVGGIALALLVAYVVFIIAIAASSSSYSV